MREWIRRTQEHFLDHPWLGLAWSVNLLVLPLMALFGRGLAQTLGGFVGTSGIRWLLGGSLVLLSLVAARWFVQQRGWFCLLYPVGATALLVPIMMYISRNPERWLHIPLFGLLGFLSASFFSIRTGAEISLAYAFGDELLQLYLPQRHGSFEDVVINGISAGIGVVFCCLLTPEKSD